MTHAAGIDVGGTKLLGVVIDLADPSSVLAEHRLPTPAGAAALESALLEMAGLLGLTPDLSLGLGIPGLVDREGVIRMGPNLPGVVGADFGHGLAASLGLDHVSVDNDATCAVLAEHRAGSLVGSSHAIAVTLGTGIGAGFISGGDVLRGARGFAAEPGHMMVDPNGPLCPCGRHGCWERYASGNGLAWLAARAAAHGQLDSVDAPFHGIAVVAAAREGDAGALAVIDEFAWWIAAGVANLIDILDPDLVALGGGVIDAADLLIGRVNDLVGPMTLGHGHRPVVPVVAATMGPQAGAIGAALLGAHGR